MTDAPDHVFCKIVCDNLNALLDEARDEILTLRTALATAQAERDAALQRAEQAEAALAAVERQTQAEIVRVVEERDAFQHERDLERDETTDLRAALATAQAERDALSAQLEADLAAARAEVTRLYDELGRVSEELGLPRSIGPAPGWLKQQMADLKEARQLLTTRVEADRLSEANDKIAALKSALESAAVGLGQSRVDRIAELEDEVKTLRVFANAALEHQREAESALDTRLLDARLSGNALDDTIVERDEARAALTEARRVLREAEWGKSSEWCCICLNHECHGHSPDCALAAVLAQEEK